MSTKRTIQVTRNYRLFKESAENRPLDLRKHKKLLDSMKKYGFLKCFPIVVCRDKNGNLVLKDGQHRLAIAETLGLPVYWVEEDVDFDVAAINSTPKVWAIRDYARKYAENGKKDYQEGIDFADQHGLPIGIAFAMLAGTVSFNNIQNGFLTGSFKVKDRKWADSVAGIYGPMVLMSASLKSARFLEACMAVCRIPEFDPSRLLACAERCREKLVAFSNKDAYLDMLERVYNFGRVKLFALKIAAIEVMRERTAAKRSLSEPSANGKSKARKDKPAVAS